jgi:AcrR family transcriptional regulator
MLTMAANPADPRQRGHRERKKQRTRQALVDAATRLIEENGYEKTTIAAITAAAGIAPRTFFSYFDSKEDVLFADSFARLGAGLDMIGERVAGETVVDVLVRVIETIVRSDDGDLNVASGPIRIRMRLIFSEEAVPAVQARAMWWLFDAQARLAAALHDRFADELDETAAAAIVGAFVGAMINSMMVSIRRGDAHTTALATLRRAAQIAIQGIATPVPR